MARTIARIQSSVLIDPDWRTLTTDAQWLYWVLLLQPKLSLAGHLDLVPKRWVGLASDAGPEVIAKALDELQQRRYIVLDQVTDELIIRTFTRHDLDPSRLSPTLVKGVWTAWGQIISPTLREHVVTNMPDGLWTKAEPHAPPEAAHIRRSAPLERDQPAPSERETPSPFESPVSCLLSPVSCLLPSEQVVSPAGRDAAPPADDHDDDDVQQLLEAIAHTRAARLGRTNPAPQWITTTARSLDAPRAVALAAAGRTPAQIDLDLEQPATTGTPRTAPEPDVRSHYETANRIAAERAANEKPPLDPTAASQAAAAAKAQLRGQP